MATLAFFLPQVYDWSAAAGDVGGMVGMLLGASLLGLLDSAADSARWLWGKATATCAK